MASYKEIQSQIEALQQQAQEARETELSEVIEQIKQLMQDYGITVEDLTRKSKKGVTKAKGAAKYRDPETGDEWSGRGRMPLWLSGKDKDQYLVRG